MKKCKSICSIIALSLCILTGCGQQAEQAVITLVYDGTTTEVSTSEWNEKSVTISTEDMGLGGDKVYDYVGVKLSDLMEMAKADECVKVIIKASDGYSREVSAADARNYDIALVSGYDNGEAIPEEEGGPLKLVFPISDHPELKNTYDTWSWIWYVAEIDFVK